MATMLPQTGPSTPADPSGDASSPRLPRLGSLPPSATLANDTRVEPRNRRPKAAGTLKRPHERDPAPMGAAEAGFIDTQFDAEDAASYQDALLVLESLANRMTHLTRHQTRVLLALSLFPLLFKPPEQHATTKFSSRALSKPSHQQPRRTPLLPYADDPLAISHRRLRESARALLEDALGAQGGAELVSLAVRGYGMPMRGDSAGTAEPEEPPRKKLKEAGKGKGKARAADRDPNAEHPHDGDDALTAAANRILEAPDLWDVLGGTTARKERLRTKEAPLLEVGAWELVRVLVKAWEDEAMRKADCAAKQNEDIPDPLSLLCQFNPSPSSSAARQFSPKALDVVFWPFVNASSDGNDDDGESSDAGLDDDSDGGSGSAEEDESMADKQAIRKEQRRKKKEQVEADGTGLADKREVAVRLLKLIGDSAVHGYLDGETTISELVQRMKALSQFDFVALVELLVLVPTAPVFTIRLLTAYLETHSHPPSTVSHLHPAPANPNGDNSTSQQPPTSPRKLAQTSSIADAAQHARVAYWRLPTLPAPAALVALTQRVPREVSLSPAQGGGALPRRAQWAAERFVLVKVVVVELLLARTRATEGSGGEVEDALRLVREAMERVEGVVMAAKGVKV